MMKSKIQVSIKDPVSELADSSLNVYTQPVHSPKESERAISNARL